MRGLTPLGSPIAWLFAQSIQGSENGFDITGGKFNYTAEVTFPDTGHAATIKFNFNVSEKNQIISENYANSIRIFSEYLLRAWTRSTI